MKKQKTPLIQVFTFEMQQELELDADIIRAATKLFRTSSKLYEPNAAELLVRKLIIYLELKQQGRVDNPEQLGFYSEGNVPFAVEIYRD